MSELRRRKSVSADEQEAEKLLSEVESDHKEDLDSEDDKGNQDLSQKIPQGTEHVPKVFGSALQGLPDRWRNWVIRGVFTFLMIGVFCLVIYGGPLALMITTLIVQVKCFEEIINIGYAVYRIHGLPWFRSLSWYFLVASNYFFYGESLVDYFGVVITRTDYLRILVTYHRFFSFCLYIVGFVWFVLSLVNKYYMKQFSLFAWTHVALLIVVSQSYLIIQNIFEGLIWFIVPVSMIVCNDVWAYVFGFFFGRTPLIKLSPKKTWEGFIGGGVATVIFGLLMSSVLCQYKYFICPIEYNEKLGRMTIECDPSYLFRPTEYTLPVWIANITHMTYIFEGTITEVNYLDLLHGTVILQLENYPVSEQLWPLQEELIQQQDGAASNNGSAEEEQLNGPTYMEDGNRFSFSVGFGNTITMYPFLLHSLSMSLFSSVIGPFGGFFASGFKRAFKIKDFGAVIPGHGGIMDRFDCQYLMATFVNVYISSFIKTASPQKLLQQVYSLKPEQQLEMFYTLKTALENRGILGLP